MSGPRKNRRKGSPSGVFLLDDQEVVRRGLKDLLEADGDIVVVGESGLAQEATRRIPALRPHVAVLDGLDGAGTWCGLGVLAHNSVKIAALTTAATMASAAGPAPTSTSRVGRAAASGEHKAGTRARP